MQPIQLVEVGPRDGLQNEKALIPTERKIAFVNALSEIGVAEIEVSSFVSPKWVPQLADAEQVFAKLKRKAGIVYSALVPNERGMARALTCNPDKISVFTAASERFNEENVHTTIDGTFERFAPVLAQAALSSLPVRGYLSTVFWCPYSGAVDPQVAVDICMRLFDAGCTTVSLGDTIGKASVAQVESLLDLLLKRVDAGTINMHFHDTYGRAAQNVLTSWRYGITSFDASTGGLGGCPYAPGAAGNVAMETVACALKEAGAEVRLDFIKLAEARQLITHAIALAQIEEENGI